MADVCLASLPTLERAKSPVVPHWLLWLTSYVERQGHEVAIVDIKSNINKEFTDKERERIFQETIEKVVESHSALIGLSGFTEDYHILISFARAIKERTSAKIVVGGIHASIAPEDYFACEDSPIDFVVVGDGEIPLTQLIEAGKMGYSAIENINGLVFIKKGEIHRNAPQTITLSLDDMPILPYHKLDINFYLQPHQLLTRWVYLSGLHIFTARGCPYSCTFCANRLKKVRYRSVDSVIKEITFLKETYGIDGFYIHDDTFTIKRDRVLDFCDKLTKQKNRLIWGMEGRVNQFPDEVFSALKKSGCIQIDFGVESGSQDALNRMNKGILVEDIKNVFSRCRAARIRTFANILINTPEEIASDVDKTIELMDEIKATVYGIGVTTPFPGTEIYDNYVKPPLSIDDYQLYSDNKSKLDIIDPRFRMNKHSIDIGVLYKKLNERFVTNRGWQIVSLHPAYLRSLFFSKRKRQYCFALFFRLFRRIKNIISKYTKHIVQGMYLSA
jgi:radical SAM superfamily enzyme YgiQ (UPF0313 family)